ncbi:MAG TPA: cytochrome c maturation protein CcmE [Gemmatimonadaceae bacterium]|nr:cytochrome c maturation protein CcmE [Gemmatimonadaceae bacterium]
MSTTGKRIGMGLAALAILGTFGFLIYGGIGENLVYFLTPQELFARGDKAYDVPLRLGGQVVPGSVEWNADKVDLRFKISDGVQTVAVHSSGAPPQMFRDGIGVVVEGRYNRAGVFESTSVMVKHSNEYRAPKHGEKPAEMYRSLTREDGA